MMNDFKYRRIKVIFEDENTVREFEYDNIVYMKEIIYLKHINQDLMKRIEEVKNILKPYVEDKEANRYAPIYRAYDELGGFADE